MTLSPPLPFPHRLSSWSPPSTLLQQATGLQSITRDSSSGNADAEPPQTIPQGRIQILEVHARDKRMAPDADFHRVARATGGFSGAQLMNVMNVAAIAAVQRGAPTITTEDMFYVTLPPLPARPLGSWEDGILSPLNPGVTLMVHHSQRGREGLGIHTFAELKLE